MTRHDPMLVGHRSWLLTFRSGLFCLRNQTNPTTVATSPNTPRDFVIASGTRAIAGSNLRICLIMESHRAIVSPEMITIHMFSNGGLYFTFSLTPPKKKVLNERTKSGSNRCHTDTFIHTHLSPRSVRGSRPLRSSKTQQMCLIVFDIFPAPLSFATSP